MSYHKHWWKLLWKPTSLVLHTNAAPLLPKPAIINNFKSQQWHYTQRCPHPCFAAEVRKAWTACLGSHKISGQRCLCPESWPSTPGNNLELFPSSATAFCGSCRDQNSNVRGEIFSRGQQNSNRFVKVVTF